MVFAEFVVDDIDRSIVLDDYPVGSVILVVVVGFGIVDGVLVGFVMVSLKTREYARVGRGCVLYT